MKGNLYLLLALLFSSAISFNGYAQVPSYVPTSGLLAWYGFNGNVNNSYGSGNNGVAYGAVSYGTDRLGSVNSCYVGNGSCGIDLPANNFPTGDASRSVSCWYKIALPYAGSFREMFATGSNSYPGDRFGLHCDGIHVGFESVGDATGPTVTIDGAWHHLVVTYPASGGGLPAIKVYIDGALTTPSITGSLPYLTTDTGNIHTIGALFLPVYTGGFLYSWVGSLDDIGVWNRELTACEISNLYNGTYSTPVGSTTGTLSVCVGSTTTLVDTPAGGIWTSGSTSIATIGSVTGIVTGVAAGTASISYSIGGGCPSIATVTVIAVPAAITGSTSVCTGSTITLSDVTTGGVWSSSSSTTASVGSTGIVTGVATGSAIISYTSGGLCSVTAPVTVNLSPAAISGSSSVSVGSTITLTDATSGGTWSSSNPSVATVGSSSGVVTGVLGGGVTISYTVGSCSATATVLVNSSCPAVMKTYAGTTSGFSGDGGPAVSAKLFLPEQVAADAANNLYVADFDNSRIRKISPAGTITTYAGNGVLGYSGDGGPATSAAISTYGVTAFGSNVYICDDASYRIRKVDAAGIITTVAGNGTAGHSGDGGPATAASMSPMGIGVDNSGSVYIAESTKHYVRRLTTTGFINSMAGNGIAGYSGDGGPATLAQINTPMCVTADASGNVYFSEKGNSIIRKVDVSGIISTFAGNGTAGFSGDGGPATAAKLNQPMGLSFDSYGNMYIAEFGNSRIRKVDISGIITTVAGNGSTALSGDGGPATAAKINRPTGVYVDVYNNIFIADYDNNRVREITYSNVPPKFAYGHSQSLLVCGAGVADTISSLLVVRDTDIGQSETWSVVSGPSHGVLVASYTTTSTGSPLTPHGLYYTATSGYTGSDTFRIEITDCNGTSDTMTIAAAVYPATAPITGVPVVCTGASTPLADITPGGLWGSTAPGVASVGSVSGYVFGATTGTSIIFYTPPSGCMVTTVVTVNPTPSAILGSLAICKGSTSALADALSGGSWSSLTTSVASVGSLGGLVSALSVGTSVISYTMPTGCATAATVTVNLSPSVITGPSSVCTGSSVTLADSVAGGAWSSPGYTVLVSVGSSSGAVLGINSGVAIVTYALPDGCSATRAETVNPTPGPIIGVTDLCAGTPTTLTDGTGGIWTSGAPSVASVGLTTGVVTPYIPGTAVIYYAYPTGCSTSVTVTVNAAPAPITTTMPGGVCVGLTDTLRDITTGGTWSSSDYSVANIDPVAGIVTGVSAGVVTITYQLSGGCFSVLSVTVNAAAVPITGVTAVCVGSSDILYDGGGGGTWTSGSPSVATIDPYFGVYTGVTTGTALMTYATTAGCTASILVTVNTVPSAITGVMHLCPLTATTLGDGTPGGTWTSASPGVAMIGSSSGIVSGITAGTAVISYSLGTSTACSVAATVTVNPLPSAISGTTNVCPGATTTLSDAGGGTWLSSNPTTASVGSLSGIVTGGISGSATITYTLPTGCFTTTPISVNAAPTAISGLSSVCIGTSITMTDLTSGGIWSASNTDVTIGSLSGSVIGVTNGVTTISYTMPSGCFATRSLTVNTTAGAISGTPHVCMGLTTSLTDATPGGVWTSALPTIASVGSLTGIVSGIASGPATITYTAGTCYSTVVVTVNALPFSITGLSSVCLGSSIIMSDLTTGGTWSTLSSGISIGSATGIVTGIIAGTAGITYTAPTGCTRTTLISVNALPALSGPSAVCVGSTITETSSPGGTWTSGTTSVATIGSLTGVVSGIALGATLITYTASSSGCSATKTVTVSPTPSAITGASSVCAGSSTTLGDLILGGTWSTGSVYATVGSSSGVVTGSSSGTAVISYSLGSGCTVMKTMTITAAPAPIGGIPSVCTGASITLTDVSTGGTWSSGSTGIATIGSTTGIVGGVTSGSAGITYTIPSTGCSSYTTVTVNTSPAAITGPAAVCLGSSITEGDLVSGGVWSTAGSGVSVGSSTGLVTGMSGGPAVINYTIGSCSVTRTVSVNTVAAITGSSTLCIGYTTLFTDATTGGTWTSGAPLIASVGSLTGLVTGGSSGSTTITYTSPAGCTAMQAISVNSGPAAITGTTHVCMDLTTTLNDATTGGSWTSASPSTASVGSSTGIVTGVASGTATISYHLGSGCYTTTIVTVNPRPLAITGTTILCAGSASTLSDGSSGGTWSSSSTGVATIGSLTGTLTGISAGSATITYSLATGCYGTKPASINPLPASVSGPTNVCAGQTITLTDSTTGGTWTSGSGGIASIGSLTGVVSGISSGVSTITFSLPTGCRSTRSVTVNSVPSPITGAGSLCAGSATTLTDAVLGGTWTSSNTGVATIGSFSGLVTGIAAGTTTISYIQAAGCGVARTITVNALPASITGSSGACIGQSTTLADVTTGGSWSSSNSFIATVGSATGVVNGVASGTAIITYATSAGCIATYWITVNALPPAITGGSAVCAGSTLALGDPATGGSWSSGSTGIATVSSAGIVTGVANGTAIISYTAATACSATHTVSVTAIPAITGLNNLCAWGDTLRINDVNTTGVYTSSLVTVANLGSGNGRITANAPGVATIYYTIPMGCYTSATMTVNSLPGNITGLTHICTGTTATLGNSISGGTWSSSSTSIATIGSSSGLLTGIATGTAYVTYILPTGCKADTPVHVNPVPAMIVGFPTMIVTTTETYTDATVGGTWSSSNPAVATAGATTGIVHGVAAGVFTLSYTLSTGCAATKVVSVNILGGVSPGGTEEVITEGDIKVIPNPSKGTFTIAGTLGSLRQEEEVSIELTNMLGQPVYKNKFTAHNGGMEEQVQLGADVASGMYLLTIRSASADKVMHIVISR